MTAKGVSRKLAVSRRNKFGRAEAGRSDDARNSNLRLVAQKRWLENMSRSLLAIMAVAVLTGCGRKNPVPAGRLNQPAGQFSFVTPEGWFRTKLAGIDYIIVSGESDFGTQPNLFVDFVKPSSSANHAADDVIQRYKDNQRAYEVSQRNAFATDSGLPGLKITARRETKDALPLATFHYVIQDAGRAIVITASCAAPVKEKYEPIFDSAMRSLESKTTIRP